MPDRFSEWSVIHLYCGRCGSEVGIRSVCRIKKNELKYSWTIRAVVLFINSLCSASNRTIRLEFGIHRSSYECVVHIPPNDCDHRNSNCFHSIYYRIYRCQQVCRFSSHQIWNWKAVDVFLVYWWFCRETLHNIKHTSFTKNAWQQLTCTSWTNCFECLHWI